MIKITTVILTKNEEKNIERAIKSVSFSDEILIIDDYSTDLTLRKIEDLKTYLKSKVKINVVQSKLNNDFAGQRNRAIEKAEHDWILFLDADEEVTPELQKEIILSIGTVGDDRSVYFLKRRDFFWGKELESGETQKVRTKGLIRLFKKNTGKWTGVVHEEYVPKVEIITGQLSGFINHFPHQTLSEFISDINIYSDIRALELHNQKVKSNILQILFFPSIKFIVSYFFRLGFLDGASGFVYAFLMSFYSFLVRTKLFQIQNKKQTSI